MPSDVKCKENVENFPSISAVRPESMTYSSLHTMMDKKYTDDTQQHIISVLIYAENICDSFSSRSSQMAWIFFSFYYQVVLFLGKARYKKKSRLTREKYY